MILGGSIVGLVGTDTVVSVGGSLLTLPDPGLPVGSRVQLVLVPGSTYRTTLGSARGARRIVMLDGPQRVVLRVPRAGEIPARVDLQLRAALAPVMARAAASPIDAVSVDRDNIFVLPPEIRRLIQLPSGPIPQQ